MAGKSVQPSSGDYLDEVILLRDSTPPYWREIHKPVGLEDRRAMGWDFSADARQQPISG